MKLLAAIILAFTVCGSLSVPIDNNHVGNPIDDLIQDALEYIRKLFREHEPFPVPAMPDQTIKGDGIDLVIKFGDLFVSKASDFSIDHIENNILQMWAKFGVTVPNMHLEGGYEVTGTYKGKNVQGKGNFKLDISQLVTRGYVEIGIVDYYVQMKTLNIDYDINDIKFSEDGLSVEGMSEEEVAQLFDSTFTQYFKDNKDFVASQVSEYVMGYANNIMRGKTLQELLDWLKKFIHG